MERKSLIICILIGVLFLCCEKGVFAEVLKGEVVDVFGKDNATIQIENKHDLHVGDQIDLTYKAGFLPMVIGVYEITTVQKDVVLTKPISLTMSPDKGMKVEIDVLKGKGPGKVTATAQVKNKQDAKKSLPLLGNDYDSNVQLKNGDEEESLEDLFARIDAGEDNQLPPQVSVPQKKVSTSIQLFGQNSNEQLEKNESLNLSQKQVRKVPPIDSARKYTLGVEITNSLDVSKQRYADFPMGVIVLNVQPNSAADQGGLQVGDMIYSAGKESVGSAKHFIDIINRSNGTLKMKIQRGKKKIKKKVILDRVK